jgi:mitochondrial fission protein ELM1
MSVSTADLPGSMQSCEIPECVTLPVRAGLTPGDKPPVRIYLGTEPAQYRAERVFLWSIERVRDPNRIYHIYLMKELPGFNSRRWLTGFTNYRFAIPYFAGGEGRAIYNDVDQVYLDDPGHLFDLDLGEHGYLAISPRDTSVMLLDCARMIDYWTLDGARRLRKNKLIDKVLATPNVYGRLDRHWNARDQEFVQGRSKCVHFTTLHKQPWQPFPERFVYQPNPAGGLFHDLERSANHSAFNVFSAQRPSQAFMRFRQHGKASEEAFAPPPELVEQAVDELVARSGARTVLKLGPGHEGLTMTEPPRQGGIGCETLGLLGALQADIAMPRYDGVICPGGLEQVPDDDIPWVTEKLFHYAAKFLFVIVHSVPPRPRFGERRLVGTVRKPQWWATMLANAAACHPNIHWQLMVTNGSRFTAQRSEFYQGGPFLNAAAPRVWLLEDEKPGHSTQSLGLVEELGWPYERIHLCFERSLAYRKPFSRDPLAGLTPSCAARLAPPWPDLVVACGARTVAVAEWLRNRSAGRARIVYLGRKGAYLNSNVDLAVAPAYLGLYPDPRRIETIAPLNRVRDDELARNARRWQDLLQTAPAPRIALLVGGDDPDHELTPGLARHMGADVADLVRRRGGSVLVTTSRRTSARAAGALRQSLGDVTAHFHRWTEHGQPADNPYLGYLALADVLVVTGESASMLAEACATGKPVLIYRLQRRGRGLNALKLKAVQGFSHAVKKRAFARPVNRRGWERPQRGLELLCARLVAHGWVRPRNSIDVLHEALVEQGYARYFDVEPDLEGGRSLNEIPVVAERVRALLGVSGSADLAVG